MKELEIKEGELNEEGLSKHFELRKSPFEGTGLFATKDIKAGTIVWISGHEKDTKIFSLGEIEKFTEDQKKEFFNHAYRVGKDRYSGPVPGKKVMSDYWNHSCDPNTEALGKDVIINGNLYKADDTWIARRDIKKGEEITYDYGTSELDLKLECTGWKIGEKDCRKVITGKDWMIPEVQKKYKGHFMSHVQKLIDEHKKLLEKNANLLILE